MAWPAVAAEPVKKVLVIGIDGCRFDALKQADAPHLDALMEAGAVAQWLGPPASVVTSGVGFLADGDSVRIVPAPAATH
jgi:3-hydroxy-3-methylglutaryl CoA synthase